MTRLTWIAIAAIFTATPAPAQDLTGTWAGVMPKVDRTGSITSGRGARYVVTFSKNKHGELTGVMAEQLRGNDIYNLTAIAVNGSKVSFAITIPAAGTSYFTGTLSEDGRFLDGWFMNLPLKLERSGRAKNTPATAAKAAQPHGSPAESTPVPATPATLAAQSAVLSRALEKLKGGSGRMLRYTCLETIERSYYSEPVQLGAHPMSGVTPASCNGQAFSKDDDLFLQAEDRLRLQVAVSDGKEIHSWAAASRFDSRSVFEMIPNGPMSTGAFGSALVDIFENAGVRFSFTGARSEGARQLLEYAFEVDLPASHSSVQAGNEWVKTGYRGAFELDAATADLVHLTTETDPLPPETKMCRNRTSTEYHYMPIGNGQFLIPLHSEFDILRPGGDETRSVTTFSACHEYAAESSVSFDDGPQPLKATATGQAAEALPAGLSITLALLAPIDTRTAASGDAVSAKVIKPVRAPGSGEILVDAGAIVHGRLTQVRHQFNPAQFLFAIRYETLEQRGSVAPVAIELDRELKAEQARGRNALSRRGTEFSLASPSAADESGSWFSASAASGSYVMAAGTESKWITVAK